MSSEVAAFENEVKEYKLQVRKPPLQSSQSQC
jgi:hypothetical protein